MDVVKYMSYGILIGVPVAVTFCEKIGCPAAVSGPSMRPTLTPVISTRKSHRTREDIVWVSKLQWNRNGARPGDVIAFISPINSSDRMVKRIIAVERETILTRNRKRRQVLISDGHLWVEGDNSQRSKDCNSFGPSKPVYELHCMHCENTVCLRGMKAILLADRSVELFSTDHPPLHSLKSVGKEYQTTKCLCWISDMACSICGQAAGYHVRVPCQSCLSSCNNGHFWMYHSDSVRSEERLDASGEHILVWAEIPPLSEDTCTVTHDNKLSYIECSR